MTILPIRGKLGQEKLKKEKEVSKEEEPVHYTARHLLQALNNLEDHLLDRPLVLIHGKDLTKPNLVSGIIPAPIPVDQTLVEGKKPSLLALADLLLNPVTNGKPPSLTGVDEKGRKIEVKTPLVHYRDGTQPIEFPFGHVQRIVTGGEGGIANVHIVKITKGTRICTRATTKCIMSSRARAQSRSVRRFILYGPAAWP